MSTPFPTVQPPSVAVLYHSAHAQACTHALGDLAASLNLFGTYAIDDGHNGVDSLPNTVAGEIEHRIKSLLAESAPANRVIFLGGGGVERKADPVDERGEAVHLPQIDYIRIQTGVNTKAGNNVGEISTEVCGVGCYRTVTRTE